MNKIIKSILVLFLTLTIFGCSNNQVEIDEENCAKFDVFIDGLPSRIIKPTDTAINQLFTDPTNIGITPDIYEWDYLDIEDATSDAELNRTLKKELDAIDFRTLDSARQENYQVLEYALKDDGQDPETYYLLSNNPLGAYNGSVSEIFISLYFYEMRNEEDVKSYMNLIDTLDEYAKNLVEFEQLRQDRGYGMTNSEIEMSKESIENVINNGNFEFIVEAIDQKIWDLALDEDTKNHYIDYINMEFIPCLHNFYTICLDGLNNLDVKQIDGATLVDLEGGQEYYESIVYQNSGFGDMEEYYNYLLIMLEDSWTELLALAEKIDSTEYADEGEYTTDIKDPNELLAYFKEVTKNDFPQIGDFGYEMVSLPKEFGDLMPGVGAFYVIGPLDDKDAEQHMMLNGEFSARDFRTVAHEGYPGHMYQHVYTNGLNLPYIRNIIGFIDYTEGYANYIESYITRFADIPDMAKFDRLNDEVIYAMILMFDYQINYSGDLNFQDIVDIFGDEESALGIYEQLQFNPGVFIPYYVAGSRINKMYERFDDNMSLEEFHENILKHGVMPLNLLEDMLVKDSRN